MSLYSDSFYAEEINQLFSDENTVVQMLRVEAALAQAQAELKIIPQEAAEVISESCTPEFIDVDKLKAEVRLGGNAAIPLVQQLTKLIKIKNFEAAKYVHLGATSQDIIDTASVLAIKEYLDWITEKLVQLDIALVRLTEDHLETIMIGRTLLQQAKPITFGFKTAGWLTAIKRSRKRIEVVKGEVLQLQLGGAVGGGNANITTEVQEKTALILGLKTSFSWQSNRDTVNELASVLGILSGSLGKIAKDVSLLMQTEVAEVFEGAEEGKGGSSTMPHKRNPVTSALILSNSARTPQLVATMLASMVQEHERSAGYWHAEWETLTQLMGLTAGSLEKTVNLILKLEVNPSRMLANIEITKGLIFAEKVSLQLSKSIGKMQAHEAVKKACKKAISANLHLKDVIAESYPEIQNLEELFQPRNAIGHCVTWVKELLQSYQKA